MRELTTFGAGGEALKRRAESWCKADAVRLEERFSAMSLLDAF